MAEAVNEDTLNIFAGYALNDDRQRFIAALAQGVARNCEEHEITDLDEVKEDYYLAKSLGREARNKLALDESRVASFVLGWDVDFQAVLFPQVSKNLSAILIKARTSWGNQRYHVSTFRRIVFPLDSRIKADPHYFRQFRPHEVNGQINPDLIYNPEDIPNISQ